MKERLRKSLDSFKNMSAKEKRRSLKLWIFLFTGSILIAASFVLFFTPYNIVPGGVYGAGVALHELMPFFQVGTWGWFMDIPLLICAFLIFGGGFGAKTVVSAFTIPLVMNTMTHYIGADPATMLNGAINLSDDIFLACVVGSVIMGTGVALILKSHATSGGTDVVAIIVTKFLKIPISRSILIVDSMVVIFGLIVFGDWKVPLYSLLSIFIFSKVIDVILEGGSGDKLLFIVSEQQEKIKKYIMEDLGRGGTYIKSAGMYTNTSKDMMFVVVSRSQMPMIQDYIRQQDPKAFMVIVNAHETLGDGFREFTKPIGG